ncbi:hypothetical protein DFJ73DRAFT_402714 [Zopfochytrium polystomum]|nr:hypothetical protein DFJ73DRAFT_402714 [Zopfochytrium polystomum]
MVSSTKYSASSSEPSPATAATAAAAAAAAVRTAALFAPPLTSSSHAPKVPTGPGTSGGANNSGDICSAGRHNNHHNNNNFDNSDMLFTHHHHHHHHPPSALAHRLEGAGFYDPFPLPSHTHSSLSPADLLVPSSSSSSSKSWPQELEKRTLGFFSNNKILDLLGIAAGILLLDGIARWRLRLGWALFCIFSLVTLTTELSRSVRSGTLLVLYTASLSVVLFAVLQWTFLYPLLPPLANMFVYGYVIGSTRGYEAMYWALWSALITVDTLVRTSPVSDLEACAGAHCISFGSFLLLKEIVTVIAERRNLTLETRKLASGELRIYSLYDQESASSSPPSPPSSERKYAYSNWNCKTNRFELCLEKLAQNFAIVSWTLPQSLILTLRDSIQRCYQSNRTQNSLRKSRRVVNLEPLVEPYFPYNLLKSNSALRAVDESWDREDTFGTPTIRGSRVVAVPYAPLLSSTLQSSPPTSADILIPSSAGFNASNTPADSCLCLPHLGFGTSLFISQSDIHVLVNGKPWTRGLASSLAEGLIAISDLEEGFDYEVVVSIRGYCSIPLRIHTAGKPPLPARRESKVEPIDQIPAAAANGDASSADSDSIDRRERISSMKAQIDGLRASHKTHVAELRKLRKAIAKSLAGYRSEIEAVQKQISKEAANDVRFRQRIQTLSEQLRSATEAEASAKQELERLESGRKAALVEVSQMEVKLESAKVALKKSSDQATANGSSNKSSVEADLTAIDAKLEDLRAQLKSLESEDRVVRQHTIPKLKNLLEKALSRKAAAGNR